MRASHTSCLRSFLAMPSRINTCAQATVEPASSDRTDLEISQLYHAKVIVAIGRCLINLLACPEAQDMRRAVLDTGGVDAVIAMAQFTAYSTDDMHSSQDDPSAGWRSGLAAANWEITALCSSAVDTFCFIK